VQLVCLIAYGAHFQSHGHTPGRSRRFVGTRCCAWKAVCGVESTLAVRCTQTCANSTVAVVVTVPHCAGALDVSIKKDTSTAAVLVLIDWRTGGAPSSCGTPLSSAHPSSIQTRRNEIMCDEGRPVELVLVRGVRLILVAWFVDLPLGGVHSQKARPSTSRCFYLHYAKRLLGKIHPVISQRLIRDSAAPQPAARQQAALLCWQ
jgi:hypothetical protein